MSLSVYVMSREWMKSKWSYRTRVRIRLAGGSGRCGGHHGKAPVDAQVVDLEHAVRGHPRGLDRAQVDADHPRALELFGNVERPDARAGAAVEDVVQVGRERRRVQVAVQHEEREMVREVESVLLQLVVRRDVLTFGVAVVAPAILVHVIADRRRERLRAALTAPHSPVSGLDPAQLCKPETTYRLSP
jgi:hypothetical protein